MADVVSLLSSIIQLVDFGAKIVDRLNEFTSDAKSVPKVFQSIKARFPLFIDALECTRKQADSGLVTEVTAKALRPVVDGCFQQITNLGIVLDKILPSDGASSWRKYQLGVKSLLFDKDIQQITSILEKNINVLVFHQVTTSVDLGKQLVTQGGSQLAVGHSKTPRRKPVFMVPIRRDSNFIGRAQILADIKQNVDAQHEFVVLFGTGGIGKSQIAIEYCYRHSNELPDCSIFWVHSSNFTRFVQGYKDIARKLKLPGNDDPNVDTLQTVFEWFCDDANGPWLMVLDNADDNDLIFKPQSLASGPYGQQPPAHAPPILKYLPQSSCGTIVVTTRDRRVGHKLLARGRGDPIEVLRFDKADATQLLLNKLHQRKDWSEMEAQELFETVDYLPLAVAQASSYISEQGISLAKYLALLRPFNRETKRLLEQDYYDPGRDTDSQKPVLQTWTISIDQIRSQKPQAVEILSLMAMLDRQGVSDELLLARGEGSVSFDTSIGVLSAFSLIAEEKRDHQKSGAQGQGRAFQMHRLVQFSMKARLEQEGSLVQWQERALNAVLGCCPPNGRYEYWTTWEAINPHAKTVLEYNLENETAFVQRASLLNLVADYNVYQGHYESAHSKALEAYALDRKFLSEEHEHTIVSATRIAQVLSAEGNHQKALEAYRVVWKLRETLNGKEAESTLRLMNNVGEELHWIREKKEAESIQRVLLEISHRKLGKDHPITLKSMNNLATLLESENPEEAEAMFRNMLSLYRQTLGENDPDSLWAMNDLAIFLADHDRNQEASELYRIVFDRCNTNLGSEHHHTITLRNNLAVCMQQIGNYREAEELNRDALAVSQKKTGLHSNETLSCLLNLAGTLNAQGKYSATEGLLQPFAQQKAQGGKTLEQVTNCTILLGIALNEQKKFKESENVLQGFYDIHSQELGEKDRIMVTAMNRIAVTKQFQNQYAEAEDKYMKALEISKEISAEDDELTILIMNNLKCLYVEQDRNEEAERMLQNIYSIMLKAHGLEHTETVSTMIDLAYTISAQKKYDGAEALFKQAITLCETVGNITLETRIKATNGLIYAINNRGDYLAAEAMAQASITSRSEQLGTEAQPTLWMQNFLAVIFSFQKKYDETEALLTQTLSQQRKALGEDHPDTQLSMKNLVWTYFSREKIEDAERIFGKVLVQEMLVTWRELQAVKREEIKREAEAGITQMYGEVKEESNPISDQSNPPENSPNPPKNSSTPTKHPPIEELVSINPPNNIPETKTETETDQSSPPSETSQARIAVLEGM